MSKNVPLYFMHNHFSFISLPLLLKTQENKSSEQSHIEVFRLMQKKLEYILEGT